jgi:predicted nucleic acid-binding protein
MRGSDSELVFDLYVLDASALIEFERSQDLRRRLSYPEDSIVVPQLVAKEVSKIRGKPLAEWVGKHRANVSRCMTTGESALAQKLLVEFRHLIDACDAQAIAIAKERGATLVTGERHRMPSVAAEYRVRCIAPDQFLSEWVGRRRGR